MKSQMKKIQIGTVIVAVFLLVMGAIPSVPVVKAAEQGGTVQVEQYDMDITLNANSNSMEQQVTMKVTNQTGHELSQICIRNEAASVIKSGIAESNKKNLAVNQNKTSVIESITRVTGDEQEVLPFTIASDSSVVYADLGKNTWKNGETLVFTVKGTTDIPRMQDRFAYYTTKAGKIFELSFCFFHMAAYENGEWNVNPYYVTGENRAAVCTDYQVTFHAPKAYTVAATGEESTQNGVTTIQAKQVRDFAIVACNYMKVKSGNVDGVQVNHYYFTDNKRKTYNTLGLQAGLDAVKLFDARIGQYPYEELDIVETKIGGEGSGMEYPGLIMISSAGYGPNDKKPKVDYRDYLLCSTIAHETAHQWFFAVVMNDEYQEAWLDEGFASYLEYDIYGQAETKSLSKAFKAMGHPDATSEPLTKAEVDKMVKKWEKRKNPYVNRSVSQFPSDMSYQINVYEGAELFLEDLQLTMGEEKFDDAIQEYYKTYQLKKVTTKDFIKIVENYDNSPEVNQVISSFIQLP